MESDGIIPRIKLERFSTIKDIIKLEPSEQQILQSYVQCLVLY